MSIIKPFIIAASFGIAVTTAQAADDFEIVTLDDIPESVPIHEFGSHETGYRVPLEGKGPLQYEPVGKMREGPDGIKFGSVKRTDPKRKSMIIDFELRQHTASPSPEERIYCTTLAISGDDKASLDAREYELSAQTPFLAAMLQPRPAPEGEKRWGGCVKVPVSNPVLERYMDGICIGDSEIGDLFGGPLPELISRWDGNAPGIQEPSDKPCAYKFTPEMK